MKAEDAFVIMEVDIYITRDGNSYVDERHLKTEDDFRYYGVTKKEKRYVIVGPSGIKMHASCVYEMAMSDFGGYISALFKITRRYKKDFDKTYFRFYDDAEEVVENIRRFIQWLKKPTKVLGKVERRKAKKYLHLLLDAPSSQEWALTIASPVGSNPKLRKNLDNLGRHLAEERDLLQGRA